MASKSLAKPAEAGASAPATVEDPKVEITTPVVPRKFTVTIPELKLPKGPNLYGTYAALALVSLAVAYGIYGWRIAWFMSEAQTGEHVAGGFGLFILGGATAFGFSIAAACRYNFQNRANANHAVTGCLINAMLTGASLAGLVWLVTHTMFGLAAVLLWVVPAAFLLLANAFYGDFHRDMSYVETGEYEKDVKAGKFGRRANDGW